MLHHVEFLCSVVAYFARFVHVVSKALMALCSPKASAAPAGHAGLLPLSWKKVHPVGEALLEKASKELAAPMVLAVCKNVEQVGGAGDVVAEKKAVRVARKRPSRLVIPVCCAGAEFGEAGRESTDVVEKELEVEGEGFCLASRRGVRHAMEDGYGVITDKISEDSQLAFYGVYDGHGGRAAVDFVSERLGKNIVAALAAMETQHVEVARSEQQQQQVGEDQLEMAVRAGYLTTDSEFLSQGVRGGACAATALVKDGELYVANVGDCRVVMSSNGVASALTTDQSAGREDERIRIESLGGYVSCNNGVWRVQDSLAVSRSFGDMNMKEWVISEPEIKKVELTGDCEFLVIASDGLWIKVPNQEAVDVVLRNGAKPMDSCKELVKIARSRGSRDDITVMVVDLQRFVQ